MREDLGMNNLSVNSRETFQDAKYLDPPTLHEILQAVARVSSVSILELISNRREMRIVNARFIYFALARQLTAKSFPQIGKVVKKHHTTVMHGCHKVEIRPRSFDPKVRAVREALGFGAAFQ